MTQIYIQKPHAVLAQVITPQLLEELQASEPGLVKYASIGDYLVSHGARREVMGAERFGAEFETEEQHQLQHAGSVLGLIDQLGGRLAQIEQRVTSLAAPDPVKQESKPQQAKSK